MPSDIIRALQYKLVIVCTTAKYTQIDITFVGGWVSWFAAGICQMLLWPGRSDEKLNIVVRCQDSYP